MNAYAWHRSECLESCWIWRSRFLWLKLAACHRPLWEIEKPISEDHFVVFTPDYWPALVGPKTGQTMNWEHSQAAQTGTSTANTHHHQTVNALSRLIKLRNRKRNENLTPKMASQRKTIAASSNFSSLTACCKKSAGGAISPPSTLTWVYVYGRLTYIRVVPTVKERVAMNRK